MNNAQHVVEFQNKYNKAHEAKVVTDYACLISN